MLDMAGDMGFVFGMLLKHREVCGNPTTRPLRNEELRAARILHGWSQAQQDDFEQFLNAQGLTLLVRDGLIYGIPPKAGVPNQIYILSRQRGVDLAPYLDRRWFLSAVKDGRWSSQKQSDVIFWIVRMWLTLQWFFYQKIDRVPAEVARYREAFVSERLFHEMLVNGIEKLGNAGRPEGERGVMWDALCQDKGEIRGRVKKFLAAMLDAGMIERTANEDEYQQTLVAAIEMAEIAEGELAYLMPASTEAVDQATLDMMKGAQSAPTEH